MPDWSGAPLRRGNRGEAVAELQRRLAALGYAPGPVDGRFGQLTEEAVFQLQADYRLKQDGIAGRQVAGLLRAGLPATGRLLHTVAPEEDLYALAERFSVSPNLLRQLGRRTGGASKTGENGPVAGSRLVVPVRPILAALEETGERTVEGLRRVLSRHRSQVTGLVVPWARWTEAGSLEGKVEQSLWGLAAGLRLPLVARVVLTAPDGLAPSGRNRRRGVEEIARLATRYHLPAIHLTLTGLTPEEGGAASAAVRALRRALPPATLIHLELAAGEVVPVDPAVADRVVLRLYGPSSPDDRVLLGRVLRSQPNYRVYLGLPATGYRADLAARLTLVRSMALSGAVLWGLESGEEAVFRAMADLFSVLDSQDWAASCRNNRSP